MHQLVNSMPHINICSPFIQLECSSPLVILVFVVYSIVSSLFSKESREENTYHSG